MKRSQLVASGASSIVALSMATALAIGACGQHELRPAASGAAGAGEASDKVDKLFEQWNRPDSPGCSLGISRKGVLIYEKGYGTASLESGVPITPESVFHVASVSKQFTAASILLLAQAGKLSVDDEVGKHIPEWTDHISVTVRQLMSHTAGLRDAFLLIELAAPHDGSVSVSHQLVGLLARQRGLNFAPGSDYAYNNGGYVLMAEILKRASGQSLRAFADAHIFKPLGMTHTHFHDDQAMIVPKLASGYSRNERGLYLARAPGGVVGNAGLFTTAGDMLLWEQNLATGRVGSDALVASMQQPTPLTNGQTSQYGFGLMMGRHRGLRTVSHGGGDPGASAFVVRYPDQEVAIAVLCNLDEIDSISLSQQIAEIYLADAMTAAPATNIAPPLGVTLAASQLAEHEGLYREPSTESLLRMFVRDGKLMGSPGAGADGGWPTMPLDPRRFMIPGTTITLEFEPAKTGIARALRVIGERPSPIVFERLAAFSPPAGTGASLAGDYAGAELDVTYTIKTHDAGLSLQIPGRKAISLQPIFRDGFAGSLVGVVRFSRNSRGTVTGFTVNTSGARALSFVRIRS